MKLINAFVWLHCPSPLHTGIIRPWPVPTIELAMHNHSFVEHIKLVALRHSGTLAPSPQRSHKIRETKEEAATVRRVQQRH